MKEREHENARFYLTFPAMFLPLLQNNFAENRQFDLKPQLCIQRYGKFCHLESGTLCRQVTIEHDLVEQKHLSSSSVGLWFFKHMVLEASISEKRATYKSRKSRHRYLFNSVIGLLHSSYQAPFNSYYDCLLLIMLFYFVSIKIYVNQALDNLSLKSWCSWKCTFHHHPRF